MLRPEQIEVLQTIQQDPAAHVQTAGQLGEIALEVLREQSSFAVPEEVVLLGEAKLPVPEILGYDVAITEPSRSAYPVVLLQNRMHTKPGNQPTLLSELTLPTTPHASPGDMAAKSPSALYTMDWSGERKMNYPLLQYHLSGEKEYAGAVRQAAGWFLAAANAQ